jgi:hypothetical protein
MTRRRNAAEPPKSSEARWYLQSLEIGQITPATVERKITEVREALDDARYFDREPEMITKLEDRLRDLEAVLVWDQAASVERGLAAATAKPAEPKSAALPLPPKAEPEIVVPDKTHDGFRLGKENKQEIAKLLKLAREGRISKTSISEALSEVGVRLETARDKDEVLGLQTRAMILAEALHLGKFKLRNNPGKSSPIISKGWDGLYALVDEKGRTISEGQKVKKYVVDGGRAPQHAGSSGRIWVVEGGRTREYFPGNVDLKWIHEKDWKRNNRRRNGDEDFRRLERKAKTGDMDALAALEHQALSGRHPEARAVWLETLHNTERWELRAKIVEAAARALFVDAWASAEEEAGRGRELRGELMDLAPETIPEAVDQAEELMKEFEQTNAKAVDVMYQEAAALPGRHHSDPTPEDFGHYTAMQALGHGVSWSDDHPEHGFKVPHISFVLTPGDYGGEEPELCEGCGAYLEQPGEDGFDEGDYCARCRAEGRGTTSSS